MKEFINVKQLKELTNTYHKVNVIPNGNGEMKVDCYSRNGRLMTIKYITSEEWKKY